MVVTGRDDRGEKRQAANRRQKRMKRKKNLNDSIVIVYTLSKHIEINHKTQTCCSLHIKWISLRRSFSSISSLSPIYDPLDWQNKCRAQVNRISYLCFSLLECAWARARLNRDDELVTFINRLHHSPAENNRRMRRNRARYLIEEKNDDRRI